MSAPDDKEEIKRVYEEAQRLTKLTGIKHEVDHVVPLRGVKVTGLHVHGNLKPIRAVLNRKKSNHFDV